MELRLKVKILFKMSNWEKDSGWSRKKNRLITLGHHTVANLMSFILSAVSSSVSLAAHSSHFSLNEDISGELVISETSLRGHYAGP